MRLMKHGDTIIEVVFAFAVFATVSVASIAIMNSGLDQAQRSLEGTMARDEINAQAEAIKFIHNSAISEHVVGATQQYSSLWQTLIAKPAAISDVAGPLFKDVNKYKSCDEVYSGQVLSAGADAGRVFVVNPRYLLPKDSFGGGVIYDEEKKKIIINKETVYDSKQVMHTPSLYPRIIFSGAGDNLKTDMSSFTEAAAAEGIWAFVVEGGKKVGPNTMVQYYDFYIRTCWQSSSKALSTISTIIRLYNPELLGE